MMVLSMAELSERVRVSLSQQERYLNANSAILARAGVNLGTALVRGNKLILLGCPPVAQHLAAEITGRFLFERPGLPAVALSENCSSLTAIANDYGREQTYARQLYALAQPGDFVLVMLAGVDAAARKATDEAQKLGLETLVLEMPGSDESVASETFLTAGHLLCEEAEREMRRQRPEWYLGGETDAVNPLPPSERR